MPRYYAAAIQTAMECPASRDEIPARIARMLAMADGARVGYEPFHDIRLFAFPEFAHTVPIKLTVEELLECYAVEVGDIAPAYEVFCRRRGCFVQTGTFLERDPRWPGHVFNTTLLVGPSGVLSRYRKVNPWIPWEVNTSPHDLLLQGYSEPLFPVVETEIGRLGCAICYDWLFPEPLREMAFAGAEVLIRVSAYMDPWGATAPMDWWTLMNRARAVENTAFVLAANQGAKLAQYPPFSWPGASMVVDFDGRILAQADAGEGERVVVAPIDIDALRAERARRRGHDMRGHHRSTAYQYGTHGYIRPAGVAPTMASNDERIAAAKARLGRSVGDTGFAGGAA
ncbi:MAG: nitrilase [Planctomycetota bacterium]|nr:nitrilase [Planctomycetota bacterium]MDA1105754.1 nitrilase [Planctomycetota bacterium]